MHSLFSTNTNLFPRGEDMSDVVTNKGPKLRIVQWEYPEYPLEYPLRWHPGSAVVHKGRNAHIAAIAPGLVPPSSIPIIYDDEDGIYHSVSVEALKNRPR